jgi:hypothetical protein
MEGMETKGKFSPYLFWDIDIDSLDMEKHAAYIVGRVLDKGRFEDWTLMRNYYGMDRIKQIAQGLRSLSPKALSFISVMTHTPREQFRCYTQTQLLRQL